MIKKRLQKNEQKCDVDEEKGKEDNDDELLNDNPGVSTGCKELKKSNQSRIIRSVWFSKNAYLLHSALSMHDDDLQYKVKNSKF